jgi:tetratricopeptide (TPR) repeat protein
MKNLPGCNLLRFALPAIVFFCALRPAVQSAEADATSVPATNVPAFVELRLSTNLEAEMLFTRQALEQLRREVEQTAARNAAAITSSLSLVESTLARMHERQMQSAQSANRGILIVAGVFAALGLVCLLLISLVLMRAIGRFSEVAATTPAHAHLLGPGQVPALGAGEMASMRRGAAEEASSRFQSALDQLQRRIVELEQSANAQAGGTGYGATAAVAAPRADAARPAEAQNGSTVSIIQPLLPDDEPASAVAEDGSAPASRATVLLGKGQALLNLDSAEPALKCFEEALALEPNNAEALVKKGMAFEKLQDWEQALESYDRAIEADQSMTVAYLYRGGVCNRLQRYREALESYEQALRTEKKSQAS